MIPVILIALALLVCFFLIVMYYDCHRFVTVVYELRSPKIAKPCTFVLLSDLHNKAYEKQNEELIRKIEELKPDGILVAGDMITAYECVPALRDETTVHTERKYQAAVALMKQLAVRYPVYYGLGNHEQRMRLYPEEFGNTYQNYADILKKSGIEPLVNDRADLPAMHINICGVEIERAFYGKFRKRPMPDGYLREIAGSPESGRYQILIAHNPDYFEEYARWGADLIVSGHVHGGLMRLPLLGGVISPRLTLFPKYDGGRFEQGESVMIVSRGLGTHTLPIRIFNPGELVVLRLNPASTKED